MFLHRWAVSSLSPKRNPTGADEDRGTPRSPRAGALSGTFHPLGEPPRERFPQFLPLWVTDGLSLIQGPTGAGEDRGIMRSRPVGVPTSDLLRRDSARVPPGSGHREETPALEPLRAPAVGVERRLSSSLLGRSRACYLRGERWGSRGNSTAQRVSPVESTILEAPWGSLFQLWSLGSSGGAAPGRALRGESDRGWKRRRIVVCNQPAGIPGRGTVRRGRNRARMALRR